MVNLKSIATIIKEVGTFGFILAFSALVWIVYFDKGQRDYFIDHFLLLKPLNGSYLPCIFVVLILTIALLAVLIVGTKMLSLQKKENNRLGEEKSRLQEKLLDRELNSSDPKKQLDREQKSSEENSED